MTEKEKFTIDNTQAYTVKENWELPKTDSNLKIEELIRSNEKIATELSDIKRINKELEENSRKQASGHEDVSRNILIGSTILSCELISILVTLMMRL